MNTKISRRRSGCVPSLPNGGRSRQGLRTRTHFNGRIRVAVAHEDQRILKALKQSLKGAECIACSGAVDNAATAFKLILEEQPDVVLLGACLPGLSGREGWRRFRAVCPAARFIVIARFPDEDILPEVFFAGASGYLIHPLRCSDIASEIRAVFSGDFVLCERAKQLLMRFLQREERHGSIIDTLATQEQEVVKCLAGKMRDKEIAEKMNITLNTVHTYLSRIYKKLNTHSRRGAVLRCFGRQAYALWRT